ncbi:MAG: response regulator transcription factor [Alphaproteobacteria bacterium]|nr:response regulator transcription factor [Alphaproteobacteria bacterium]MCY4319460.1 response regulator transcription factor [Alphaproteobacteria bacterium]
MKHKIALVDDDRNILTSVTMALGAEGFEVRAYADGEQAWRALRNGGVDLAILDIKMPRMDGLELLQRLRAQTLLPVIFLTTKVAERDEELGLNMGADDYIKKPFSQRLLIARIRALLRRKELEHEGAVRNTLVRGDLSVDPDRYLCTWKGDQVKLTVTELLILNSLAYRAGYVKTRDQLMTAAYGPDVMANDRVIDSHIKRMRRKFRAVDPAFSSIETLYGGGYCYRT